MGVEESTGWEKGEVGGSWRASGGLGVVAAAKDGYRAGRERDWMTDVHLSKRAMERRCCLKFSDAVHEDLEVFSNEVVFLVGPGLPGSRAEAPIVAGESLAGTARRGGVIMICRTCGRNGDHWTARCPYKGLAPQVDSLMDRPSSSDAGASSSTTGKRTYVAPGMRGGAERSGTETRLRNDENSVRVTNLSEDAHEPDLLELFGTFGPLTRAYVGVDKQTGVSRGFGSVNFIRRGDGERTSNKPNGYGYDNLILKLEWAMPRSN